MVLRVIECNILWRIVLNFWVFNKLFSILRVWLIVFSFFLIFLIILIKVFFVKGVRNFEKLVFELGWIIVLFLLIIDLLLGLFLLLLLILGFL